MMTRRTEEEETNGTSERGLVLVSDRGWRFASDGPKQYVDTINISRKVQSMADERERERTCCGEAAVEQ